MKRNIKTYLTLTLLSTCLLGISCNNSPKNEASHENRTALSNSFEIIATSPILWDVARNIAGDAMPVHPLVPPGGDPHVFDPKPSDIKKIADAKVLIEMGLTYETWLDKVYQSSNSKAVRVVSSEGIEAIKAEEHHDHHDHHHHDHGGGHAFEWAGAFKLAPGEYSWTFAKVDGDYADPMMKMVILAGKSDGIEAIEGAEKAAEGLIESDSSTKRVHGETLTPDGSKAYQLVFDPNKNVTEFRVNIEKEGVYTFFTEHMPFEFEADEHFFKDKDKKDVEPIAQEPDAGHDHHHHAHGEFDPHVWTDPNNMILVTQNIAAALSDAFPEHASTFEANSKSYIGKLEELDKWIVEQTVAIPNANRKLVTNHDWLGYFAKKYGFEVLDDLLGSVTTESSEPSPARLAELIKNIKATKVKALFFEIEHSSKIMDQVAKEAGVKVAPGLYHEVGGPDTPASDYLSKMRYNVGIIVDSLK